MTISNSASSAVFLGNGVTNPFSFNLIAAPSGSTTTQAAANIQVSYTDGSGNTNILSPTTYTLSFNANFIGGTILYPKTGSPIANGTSLTVRRIVPLTQPTSISNQGAFYPQVTESALDNLELQIQQVSARGGQYRGIWATGIVYNFGDMVIDGANGANTNNYYNCIQTNTSGTWSTDLANGDWNLEIDIQAINAAVAASAASAAAALVSQNAAASSAGSASTSAATATTQAGIATTQAGNAATSATAALNYSVAAGNYANSYSGTSATSFLIGTGAKTFVTQANKLWQPGQYLIIASNANAANYMHGSVTSYNGVSSLVMNITDIGGSGTFADWNISISGTQGPTGPSGGGITQLTGDVTAGPGSGSQASALATVNSNVGTFASATVNGKGLVTAAANLTGDITTSGAVSTLATVNSNVGMFTAANITVNAKGLITAAANGTSGGLQPHQFNSSTTGTWTTTANITSSTVFFIYLTAGGGGGGGTNATAGAAGSGGGGGTTGLLVVSGLAANTGYSYTIGAAGTAGGGSGGNGGAGGSTSIVINAVTSTAGGGGAGTGSTTASSAKAGAFGGNSATNCTLMFFGGGTGGCSISTASSGTAVGGNGGDSIWGGGGVGGINGGGSGASGSAFGAGGSGSASTANSGATGIAGNIYINWSE